MTTTEIISEEQLRADVERTIADHRELVVTDDPGFIAAQEALKVIKKRQKAVEEWFRPQVKKAHELHKELKGKENSAVNPLKQIYKDIAAQCSSYQMKKEEEARRIQREEEDRLRKEKEDEQLAEAADLAAQGKPEEAESVISQPVHVPAPPLKTAPKTEGVSYTTRWKFDIENTAIIPREFLQPDTVKIGQYVRAMKEAAKIPGVKIWPEKSTNIR